MAEQLDIPGYFYDADKKRYFKMEASSTAPPEASWSRDTVKRRRLEKEQANADADYCQRKKAFTVQRSSILQDPLIGGLLNREQGLGGDPREIQVQALTRGLRDHGSYDYWEYWERTTSFRRAQRPGVDMKIGCLYVDEDTGLVYTTPSYTGTYPGIMINRLETDDDGCLINTTATTGGDEDESNFPHFVWDLDENESSGLACYKPRNLILCPNQGRYDSSPVMGIMPLVASLADPGLRDVEIYKFPIRNPMLSANREDVFEVRSCAAALPGSPSDIIGVLATTVGVVLVRDPDKAAFIGPATNIVTEFLTDRRTHPAGGGGGGGGGAQHPLGRDVHSAVFRPEHPSTLLASGRTGSVWLGDFRQKLRAADWVNVADTGGVLAHVKPVDEHSFLAVTPTSMALYDVRYNSKIPGAKKPVVEETRPLFRFHGYAGHGRLVDPNPDVEPVDGLVAIAHGDGTLALYSLHSGERLPFPALDSKRKLGCGVDALGFAKLPGERHRPSSLFAAFGPDVHKFSFGRGQDSDSEG